MQEHGPPGPPPHSASPLDHIEARLKQLEQEEAARMAARSHLLAIRKREDEEFRRVTENAEFEEEVCFTKHCSWKIILILHRTYVGNESD